MATLGTIEFFNSSSEDWNANCERFDQHVIANEIKEEKKIVAMFQTSIGSLEDQQRLERFTSSGEAIYLKAYRFGHNFTRSL